MTAEELARELTKHVREQVESSVELYRAFEFEWSKKFKTHEKETWNAALDQAAKQKCNRCAIGDPVYSKDNGSWVHTGTCAGACTCESVGIHALKR